MRAPVRPAAIGLAVAAALAALSLAGRLTSVPTQRAASPVAAVAGDVTGRR